MTRNSVKVCIRTRPTHHFAQNNIFIDQEHATIQITKTDGEEPSGPLNNRQNSFKFRFDHVFHNASQSAVYDLFARDTVQSVVDGINGAIMSYGQTGSGKTFTMRGDSQSYEHRGIAPRSLGQIFSEVSARIEFEFKVSCTYMEIYNERIFDLLTDLSSPDQAQDYTIAEEKDGRGVFVRGLTEIEVKTESEALNLLFGGELARTTAMHRLNRHSNRSHSVFTVYLQQRQRSGVSEKVVHSKLHLVDLAGSERLKKTVDSDNGAAVSTAGRGDDGVLKRESMSINQSLTYLEQCVIALARKSSHIPYRQSKLTNILKDCLGANCNTLMLACMWGENDHLEETISTLRLASRMMKVQNETAAVETIDTNALVRKQAKLIKALKQELLMHDALVERTGVRYEPYTPEQQASIYNMLERYIDAREIEEEDILSIDSFRQMLEVCKQFKKMVLQARDEAASARNEAMQQINDGYGNSRPLTGAFGQELADSKLVDDFDPRSGGPMVGEPDDGAKRRGFALGTASADSKPSAGVEGTSRYNDSKMATGDKGYGPETGGNASMASPSNRKGRASVDFDDKSYGDGSFGMEGGGFGQQFEVFCKGEGGSLFRELTDAKATLKDCKLKIKECTQSVNDFKSSIDDLQKNIEARKASRIDMLRRSGMKASESEEIVDEEEFRLMKELREAKRSYKNGYEQLQRLRSSLQSSKTAAESTKEMLASAYTTWASGGAGFGFSKVMAESKSDFFGGEQNDVLDDQEAFDRLEVQRVMSNDPDSLAFFQAQKTRRALITQNSGNIKHIQKTKRLA